MRVLPCVAFVLALAACQPPMIGGKWGSGVRALAIGMSYNEVVNVFGPDHSGKLVGTGSECLTWQYTSIGESNFINAMFWDGNLGGPRTAQRPCAVAMQP